MKVSRLDHLVLTVSSIERTIEFYESVLGMKGEFQEGNRASLMFGTQKINLHEEGMEIQPRAEIPTPGSADLCFISETDIHTAMAHVRTSGVPIIAGPVSRPGAKGLMVSFYFRDPDDNLIEVGTNL